MDPSHTSPSPPASRSSSPIFASRSPSPTHARTSNSNDQSDGAARLPRRPSQELSDLPHLIRTHQTLGYRAGVSDGKDAPETVQVAFDQAYPVGAELGFRVGWLLSVLSEDSSETRRSHNQSLGESEAESGAEVDVETETVLERAERELSVEQLVREMEEQGLLGRPRKLGEEAEGDEQEESRTAHEDVEEEEPPAKAWTAPAEGFADSLPSICKWSAYVDELLRTRQPSLRVQLSYRKVEAK